MQGRRVAIKATRVHGVRTVVVDAGSRHPVVDTPREFNRVVLDFFRTGGSPKR